MSFEEYVAARGPALERYAYLLTGDRHRAQDLVQTALMEALVRWRRVSRVDHPDAYVRRIVTTRHLDWRRRRSSREEPQDRFEDGSQPLVGRAASSGDHAGWVADQDEMARALSVLSKPQRAVLVLRYYEGYDDATIAGVLDCPAATVRSHAHRGLARLRTVLTVAPPDIPSTPALHGTVDQPARSAAATTSQETS